MTRSRLITDSEVCMYALTVSTIEPKNIKEAMSDHSWIESMQDELHQFQRLDVWELVPQPTNRNVIVRIKKSLEALQAECDIEQLIIILQGLPLKSNALLAIIKSTRQLWERISTSMKELH
ncbi:hypothetical protein Tco_0987736 [Tanacetum coccineum]